MLDELKSKLFSNNTVILSAPPGAGKSTIVPLELLDAPWLEGKKIIVLQPRRLAAKTVAERMADLLGENLGETVGYRIRFESKISSKTRIEVVTEGILSRMLQNDSNLENIGAVIFDEFHERSIYADVALALCREVQEVLREDLRLLIMSATLNTKELCTLLKAPLVESAGKMFPVEIFYSEQADLFTIAESTAHVISKAIKEQTGDVLAFFPGEGEIRKCAGILSSKFTDIEVHCLFGALPMHQQQAAIFPSKAGKRKIVLATSIAETSLTIEGIKIVVDSGYGRTQKFDARSGLSKLETVFITKDSADQRAGRAGRLSPGFAYRMWNKAVHAKITEHRTPEILEADLCSLVLDLAQWGINDYKKLTWLSPPPLQNMLLAQQLLLNLGAIEINTVQENLIGKITEHGKKMQELPCHPRIAHLLLKAKEISKVHLAADIAALLEERDPLGKEAGVDINLRIEEMRRQRERKSVGKKFNRLVKIAEQYRKLFHEDENNDMPDVQETGYLLVHAYPERIACARPGNNAQFQLSGGNLAMISYKDDLAHEAWLAIAHLDARDGMGKIFMASPLNPLDLKDLIQEKEIIQWDTKKGAIVASKDLRLGNLVLRSSPLQNVNPAVIQKVICDAIKKDGTHLLDWNENVTQFQNRILSLQKWNSEEKWPNINTEHLLKSCEDWLPPYLVNVKNSEDLKKLNLTEIILHFLDYNQQQELAKQAPSKLEVPSGSSIKISYFPDGAAPILAVRIQEVFGLENTPTVNQGKVGMILHLLSPAYKPVQITSDLKNFWKNTYFEVKKELKQRYPKHAWPDEPWNHKAISGTKRQNGLK